MQRLGQVAGGDIPAAVLNAVDFINVMAYDGGDGERHSSYQFAVHCAGLKPIQGQTDHWAAGVISPDGMTGTESPPYRGTV